MIDRVVISISLVTLLTIVTIAVFLMIVPLFQRMAFDLVCQSYLMRMESRGGMSSAQAEQMRSELTEMGYQVNSLTASASAPFGGDLTLYVQATRSDRRIGTDLAMKEVIVSLNYQRTVVCRKIITDAGDPSGF